MKDDQIHAQNHEWGQAILEANPCTKSFMKIVEYMQEFRQEQYTHETMNEDKRIQHEIMHEDWQYVHEDKETHA